LGFNFIGNQQVKNIAEQVPVFVIAHDGAPALAAPAGSAALMPPIGHARVGAATETGPRYGTFLMRTGASFVDGFLALLIATALCVALVAALGNVVEINDPVFPLAIERTVQSDLPSTEIAAGGKVVVTTQRSLVERNFFGLATQTVRRTEIEKRVDTKAADSGHASDALDVASLRAKALDDGDVLVDPATRQELVRPSLSF